MNINQDRKLLIKEVCDIQSSEYSFKRLYKNFLNDKITVTEMTLTTKAYSDWCLVSGLFFDVLKNKKVFDNYKLYALIFSQNWQLNTRIAKYYGLNKFVDLRLAKKNILIDGEIISGHYVVFYGVICLNSENFHNVFEYVSYCASGIIFTCSGDNIEKTNKIVETLLESVKYQINIDNFDLDVVNAINIITDFGEQAMFPCEWSELGEYNFDIFKKY